MLDDQTTAVEEESGSIEAKGSTTKQHVIYCGPSLPSKYGLKQYQLFLGGLSIPVEAAVKECPQILALMVPVNDLAKARLALAVKGSAESALYTQIEQYFRKEAAK